MERPGERSAQPPGYLAPGRDSVLGAWRWALLRAWCATDDGWICYLESGDDHVRGGMLAGWYEYDERWIRPVEPLPPDWDPHG